MQKKCQKCGKTFTAGQGNYKYCDESCKSEMTPPAPKQEVTIAKNAIVGQSIGGIADRVEAAIISKMETVDMVNHPPHYKLANGTESIDVIKAILTPEEYRGWCKEKAMFFLKELVK